MCNIIMITVAVQYGDECGGDGEVIALAGGEEDAQRQLLGLLQSHMVVSQRHSEAGSRSAGLIRQLPRLQRQ